jgi:hypothetical protein
MCLTLSPLTNLHRWNWDGDRIVHKCIVPSSRPAVGRSGPRSEYDIDVREFLVAERNEVMRRTLAEDVPVFAQKHGLPLDVLLSRESGSFDLRAAIVSSFVAEQVRYNASKGRDPWQFPDETLFLKTGDCEDRALLIASLLISSGISNFNVRVALGQIHTTDDTGHRARHDHAWVMYKTEAGRWTVLEPHIDQTMATNRKTARRARPQPTSAEYVPFYLFNDAHLWEVLQSEKKKSFEEMALRRKWSRVDPKFAGDIHRSIVSDALDGIPNCPPWLREGLMRHFTSYFGNVVDDPDNFVTHGYDCYDHFDNAYIDEGWARVNQRLANFKAAPEKSLDEFAWAAHGIADFYAHTSYGEFGPRNGGKLVPFDGSTPAGIQYDTGPYAFSKFTIGNRFSGDPSNRAALWAGKLISGRYCQPGDSKSILEQLCPTPGYLRKPGGRMVLPHHDEIAVDGPNPSHAHRGYTGEFASRYAEQFQLRRDAATRHIREALLTALASGTPLGRTGT